MMSFDRCQSFESVDAEYDISAFLAAEMRRESTSIKHIFD